MAVLPGSTRASVVFFSNFGVAYTSRITDIPASTGYGEPIQRFFKLKDGERIVAAFSLDPRVAGDDHAEEGGDGAAGARRRGVERRLQPALQLRAVRRAEHARGPAVCADGRRRRGRRRRAASPAAEILIAATREARAMLCKADEVNFLSGPGRGVILIKLESKADRVLGFIASTGDRDLMTVETSRGAEQTISTTKYEVTGRGGKGRELLQRGQFTKVVYPVPETPQSLSE